MAFSGLCRLWLLDAAAIRPEVEPWPADQNETEWPVVSWHGDTCTQGWVHGQPVSHMIIMLIAMLVCTMKVKGPMGFPLYVCKTWECCLDSEESKYHIIPHRSTLWQDRCLKCTCIVLQFSKGHLLGWLWYQSDLYLPGGAHAHTVNCQQVTPCALQGLLAVRPC